MAIDFQQDIAPLRQQFFPMLVGERTFDRMVAYDQQVLQPLRDQNTKNALTAMQMQREQMAFEKYKLDMAREREDLRLQRETNRMMPDLSTRVDALIDSGRPPSEIRSDFDKIMSSSAGAITNSRTLNTYFQLQDRRLRDMEVKDAEKRAATEAERKTLARLYQQQTFGTPNYSSEVESGILKGEVGSDTLSKFLGGVFAQQKAAETQAELTAARREAAAKTTSNALERIIKVTDFPKFAGGEEGGYDDVAGGSDPAGVKFEETYRGKLISDMVRLNGGDPKDERQRKAVLEEYKDRDSQLLIDLRNKALDTYYRSQSGSNNPITPLETMESRDRIRSLTGLSD